jgi:hypothetical protein
MHDEAREVSGLRLEVASTASRQDQVVAKAIVAWLRGQRLRVSRPKTVPGPFRFSIGREQTELQIKLIVGHR